MSASQSKHSVGAPEVSIGVASGWKPEPCLWVGGVAGADHGQGSHLPPLSSHSWGLDTPHQAPTVLSAEDPVAHTAISRLSSRSWRWGLSLLVASKRPHLLIPPLGVGFTTNFGGTQTFIQQHQLPLSRLQQSLSKTCHRLQILL